MKIELLYRTDIDKLKNFNLNKYEQDKHIHYTFFISGISRALLQELVRHKDNISLSVKSTRYTLKELKDEDIFTIDNIERASKYLVFTDNKLVNQMSIKALENLRVILKDGMANDKAKYALPENYKTSLTWTINQSSLKNFLELRLSKSALWEIRDFSSLLLKDLPREINNTLDLKI
jgi:thymidylate synthase (FAD)